MIYRTFTAFLAVLFLIAAAVQYNDPDAIRWIAIYLAASAACFLGLVERLRWWFPAVVGVAALFWAVTLLPRAFPNVAVSELFAAWEMKNERVEEGREMYGLLIIAASMTLLAISTRVRRKAAVSAGGCA